MTALNPSCLGMKQSPRYKTGIKLQSTADGLPLKIRRLQTWTWGISTQTPPLQKKKCYQNISIVLLGMVSSKDLPEL